MTIQEMTIRGVNVEETTAIQQAIGQYPDNSGIQNENFVLEVAIAAIQCQYPPFTKNGKEFLMSNNIRVSFEGNAVSNIVFVKDGILPAI